jgi:flagellar protein FliO/FliZ
MTAVLSTVVLLLLGPATARAAAAPGEMQAGLNPAPAAAGEDATEAVLPPQTRESREQTGGLLRRSRFPATAPSAGAVPPGRSTAWSGLWPLAVIGGLIFLAAWVARRWLPRNNRLSGGADIEIIARSFLSSRQSLAVVRIGRRLLIIGLSPDCISALATIDDPLEVAELIAARGRGAPFAQLMRGQKDAYESGTDEPAEDQPASVEVRLLLQRVRALKAVG